MKRFVRTTITRIHLTLCSTVKGRGIKDPRKTEVTSGRGGWHSQLAAFVGIFLAAGAAALAADLNAGLVAYYPFDGSPTNVLGTGNNGTLSGAVLTTDRFGRQNAAYALDGSSYIAFPSGPPVASKGSFTYAFWMLSTRVGDYPVYSPYSWLWFVDRVSETTPVVSLGILTENYNGGYKGQFWFNVKNDAGVEPPGGWGGVMGGTLTPQQWQHIAMVRVYSNSFRLYVNGSLVGSATDNGVSLTPPAVKLGKHAWNDQIGFVGKFDDFRIYDRALSEAEVQELALINGLVAYYPFDGSATNILGTGNDGTLSGAVLTTDRFGRQNAAYALDGSGYIAFPSAPAVASKGSFTWIERFWRDCHGESSRNRPVNTRESAL